MPVFPRKNYPKGTKRWVAQVELGKDPVTGRRRYRQSYHFTKIQAEEAEAEMLVKRRKRQLRAGPDITFGDWAERWLVDVEKRIEAKTFVEYERYALDVLIPRFRHVRLGNLSRAEVRNLMDDLEAAGRSTRYREVVRAVGRKLYNDAMDEDPPLVEVNPFARVKIGRERGRRRKRAKVVLWTVDQLKAFWQALAQDPDRFYFLWKILTGARQGELFALRPEDVSVVQDDDGRVKSARVRIGRSVTRVARRGRQHTADGEATYDTPGGFVVKEPKSDDGWRTLPLHPIGVVALEQQRRIVDSWRTLAGPNWVERGQVFPNRTGDWRDGQLLRKKLTRYCTKLKLPRLTEHQLRHLVAALLILLKAHPRVIQEQLGHADFQTTMDLYGGLIEGVGAEDVLQIGDWFGSLAEAEATE